MARDIQDTVDERGRRFVYPALREALPGRLAVAQSNELSKRLGDFFYIWRRAPLGEREGDRVKVVLLEKTRENKRLWRIDCIDRIDHNPTPEEAEISPNFDPIESEVVGSSQSMQSMQAGLPETVVSKHLATLPSPRPSSGASNGHAAPPPPPAVASLRASPPALPRSPCPTCKASFWITHGGRQVCGKCGGPAPGGAA